MPWRVLSGALLLAITLSAAGCPALVPGGVQMTRVTGSGTPTQEERSVGGFTGVDLAGQGALTITLGDRARLVIEADDNLLPYLETELHGGILRLQTQSGINLHPRSPIRYRLTARTLDTVILSGSGSIEAPDLQSPRFAAKISGSGDLATGELRAAEVRLDISGSGNARLGAVRAERVKTTISGSGEVHIEGGEAAQQSVAISGSGDYQAGALASAEARVQLSGSGDAAIQAREHLQTRISGCGSVRYAGDPTVEQAISGSGRVEPVAG